jgi:osmotically-inducible protein OsmY
MPGTPAPRGGPHAGRGPASFRRSDDRIYEALCDELMLQPEIDPSEVIVEVDKGVVTLTGTVPDRWTKFAIEEVAESTLGVLDVHNRLRLRPVGEEEERRLAPRESAGRRDLH